MTRPALAPRFMSRRAFIEAGHGFSYGFHESPFGEVIALCADGALAGLGFADDHASALADMQRRWPEAEFRHEPALTEGFVARVFSDAPRDAGAPLPILLVGTDFELEVWGALLSIPFGGDTTYGALATQLGRPKAARAVGAAIGRNPIGVVVPCHRVVGRSGAMTGYHWGIERKKALLGWETSANITA